MSVDIGKDWKVNYATTMLNETKSIKSLCLYIYLDLKCMSINEDLVNKFPQ